MMRILKENTIALAIDFQERIIPAMSQREELIGNTLKLMEGLRILEVPIIATQQYTKGLGMTSDKIMSAVGENFKYFDKLTFSCLEDEAINKEIQSHNKKNIIVFGIEAHVCVMQTVVDLQKEGYQVILVEDCISSRKEHDKDIALQRMVAEGVVFTTYESILFELTRKAGSETFKRISKLIK